MRRYQNTSTVVVPFVGAPPTFDFEKPTRIFPYYFSLSFFFPGKAASSISQKKKPKYRGRGISPFHHRPKEEEKESLSSPLLGGGEITFSLPPAHTSNPQQNFGEKKIFGVTPFGRGPLITLLHRAAEEGNGFLASPRT